MYACGDPWSLPCSLGLLLTHRPLACSSYHPHLLHTLIYSFNHDLNAISKLATEEKEHNFQTCV